MEIYATRTEAENFATSEAANGIDVEVFTDAIKQAVTEISVKETTDEDGNTVYAVPEYDDFWPPIDDMVRDYWGTFDDAVDGVITKTDYSEDDINTLAHRIVIRNDDNNGIGFSVTTGPDEIKRIIGTLTE